MLKRLRPIPFPRGSVAYRLEFLRLKASGLTWRGIRQVIRCANHEARMTPQPGERCLARNRKDGRPCQAAALPAGRCRWHGGCSTGPRSEAGKRRVTANLRNTHARSS